MVIDVARLGQAREDSRKHAGAARGWRGDDDAHGRVDLLHGKRAREDVAKWRAREGTVGAGAQLCRIAADQAGGGVEVANQALCYGTAHDVQRALQRVANVVDGAALIL